MLFNSLQFLLFFILTTGLYFVLPHRARWVLLLIASCYFYMVFRPVYIVILAFTIVVDYVAGILIEDALPNRRKLYLFASLAANLGVLVVFKYYNFVNQTLKDLFHTAGSSYSVPFLEMLLPIGLSFHVFQSLSYTIEVFRSNTRAERHFGLFALYVMFYPQLVAGPIERPQNIMHQLRELHEFNYDRVVSGLRLMLWGFFKKVVIADRLAPFVNQVYDDPHSYTGISFIIATVFFAFQIYCDFSGYSDIALGSARVMGFTLMKNFDRPYFSRSVAEFWTRWHISLSTWFRDYVYISLGGNRVSRIRWYTNLLITFLISGLWHGANWTYVLWGGLNGMYLIAGTFGTDRHRSRSATSDSFWLGPLRAVPVILTFALICFSWVFFRANTTADAFYIVTHLADRLSTLAFDIHSMPFIKANIIMRQDKLDFLLALAGVAVLLVAEALEGVSGKRDILAMQPTWLRWSVYYASLAIILFFGAFNNTQQFIYFQF